MLSGNAPTSDWAGRRIAGGEPLADGWRGALCQVRGDWEFYTQLFRFRTCTTNERMCWLCRASNVDPMRAWSDFSLGAGWRATRWTHESYLAFLRGAGLAIPPLLLLAIGFRLECVLVDTMHAVDLGICASIIGNILWILAVRRRVFGGRTMKAAVQRLHDDLQAWYKREKVSSRLKGKLTVARLRGDDGFPKLKAKAAATRHMLPYAIELM